MPSGGKRVNAGRPSGQGPYGEKTKTIRVPESAVTDIKTYLESRLQRVSLSLIVNANLKLTPLCSSTPM